MDITDLMAGIQKHFSSNVVTVVGSGLSCAEGMPGMASLGDHLSRRVPTQLVSEKDKNRWKLISDDIEAGKPLEPALDSLADDDPMLDLIVELTAELIATKEAEVLSRVFRSSSELRLTRFAKYIGNNDQNHIITTNYDRLVEIAIELAGYPVDVGSPGKYVGAHDFRANALENFTLGQMGLRADQVKGKMRRHFVVYKPHGSLDWVYHNGRTIRAVGVRHPRPLMVTPGRSKYRQGYEKPFEDHRTRANAEIQKASSLVFVGYGFNDDHLEHDIRSAIRSGTPCLILTRSLSDNARKVVATHKHVWAITSGKEKDVTGTVIETDGNSYFVPSKDWWDCKGLVEEVLA